MIPYFKMNEYGRRAARERQNAEACRLIARWARHIRHNDLYAERCEREALESDARAYRCRRLAAQQYHQA